MENKTKNYVIGSLSVAFVTIASILGINLTDDDIKGMYGCEALILENSQDAFKVCTDLSAPNKDGLQTRCYYDETYSVCTTGWKEVKPEVTTTSNPTTTTVYDPIWYSSPTDVNKQEQIEFYKNGIKITSPLKHFRVLPEYENETNIKEMICTQC